MMTNIINFNNNFNFNQLVETFKNLKLICSSLSIYTDIILGVSGIALIIGMVSILYMKIENLLNPLAETGEEERNRRRRSKLSDKLIGQILENERRRKINLHPLSYEAFGPLYGHLVHAEQILLVEIMRQKPSSHFRFVFIDRTSGIFFIKNTRQTPCADLSMVIAAVEWEKGMR